jgi:hypothetical protein
MTAKSTDKPKGKGGRPSKYTESTADLAFKFALLGATDAEMAAFFDVNVDTIYEWKKTKSEFSEALKKGKIKADADVTHSLYQRANGYEWDEAQPIKLKEVIYENGKRVKEVERVEIVMVHKVVPPDPVSMIYWTKNRRQNDWRDKKDPDGLPQNPITFINNVPGPTTNT